VTLLMIAHRTIHLVCLKALTFIHFSTICGYLPAPGNTSVAESYTEAALIRVIGFMRDAS
jgi:hypothetical protein